MLFSDHASTINILKESQTKHAIASSSCQTVPFSSADKEIQSISLINEQTQTARQSTLNSESYDISALVKFLTTVEPLVSRTLMANLKSKAFLGYNASWDEDVDEISHMGTCSIDSNDMVATGVKFNYTGSSIAVAFGQRDHETWCFHKGKVCVWNIRDLERPVFNTETPNCATCLDFHPTIPGLLAVGSFNGEITLYSVFNEPNFALSCSTGEKSHSEPIANLIWQKSLLDSSFELLSVANDGKILVWNDALNNPIRGCLLTPAGITLKKGMRQDIVLGGTAMTVSKHNSNELYIGTETGYVLKVGFNKITPLNMNGSLASNCILFSYEHHNGRVTSLDLSPFYRNALVSCSSDGTIKLYSTLQAKAIYILEPSFDSVTCVSWSPSRSCILAAASVNGYIYIYDLTKNQSLPFVSFLAVSGKDASIEALCFSRNGQNLLVGDSLGKVVLWQLSSYLSKSQEGEDQMLKSLFDHLE